MWASGDAGEGRRMSGVGARPNAPFWQRAGALDLGIKLGNVTGPVLGRAKRVRIEKENTTIIDGVGEKSDIDGWISQIKAQIEQTTSGYDREEPQERLAKLAGDVAVGQSRA